MDVLRSLRLPLLQLCVGMSASYGHPSDGVTP
jgi:hypothetical protein